MLAKISVLIVEDEPIIALDLAEAVRARRGLVLGPADSVRQALAILARFTPHGAVLDAMLPDGHVTPVALRLIEMKIPFVIHTGTGLPAGLPSGAGDPLVFMKPVAAAVVLKGLEGEIRRFRAGRE